MKKTRWLLQTLILSAALNAVLLCLFFYFLIRNDPLHFSYQPKTEVYSSAPPIPASFLEKLHILSFEELISLLKDGRKVEQGYHVRDFALGALAAFHDFDVERGLGVSNLAKREWKWEQTHFLLFPGLNDENFGALQQFAHIERWPLTVKGLYKRIQEEGVEKCDPALISFFCHTPEFILLETLFARTHLPIQKRTILSLALEEGWDSFASFCRESQEQADFSDQKRQAVLMGALGKGSSTAAFLLLITDPSFALKELEDREVVVLLDLLPPESKEGLQFMQMIATSPRGDRVREKALSRLGGCAEDAEVAGHFYEKPGLKDLRPVFRQTPPAAPSPSTHIVQPGESLWQIARKYQISIESLMEANRLQSTIIQPGKSLKISY